MNLQLRYDLEVEKGGWRNADHHGPDNFSLGTDDRFRRCGASYEKTDTSVVDPILNICDGTHRYVGTDLEPGADLSSADLSSADLSSADLEGAELENAGLSASNLTGAFLRAANLSGADLSSGNLNGAGLYWADLNGADLNGVDLNGVDLNGVDLSSAYLGDADLSGVSGLGTTAGAAIYNHGTNLAGTEFNPVAAGWYFDNIPDEEFDSDGLLDFYDNCRAVNNPAQLDSDSDGCGNICDGDFNQDGVTNGADFIYFRDGFVAGTSGVTDMNGDGATNGADFILFRQQYLEGQPGPSHHVCRDRVTCR